MQVKIVRTPGKAWSPDRSRGKRFRTRPRSARGKWELVIDGRKRKPAAKAGRKNPISLQKIIQMARRGKIKIQPAEKKG